MLRRFAYLATACLAFSSTAAAQTLSEIRVDYDNASGTDEVEEYVEIAGAASTSLNGYWIVVIGDGTGGSGVIDEVIDLSGQTIPSSGYFVVAQTGFTLATAQLTREVNFENSDNVTYLLVQGFTGAVADDLDTNDDGTLDVTPWTTVVDKVALIESDTVPPTDTEYAYGPPNIGPNVTPDGDGGFRSNVPAHVFACAGTGWQIGPYPMASSVDTPGAANPCAGTADAGPGAPDALPAPDAAPGAPDAAPGAPDARPSSADAAVPADARPRPDAGGDDGDDGGCGCRLGRAGSTGGTTLTLAALAAALLLVRRRRA